MYNPRAARERALEMNGGRFSVLSTDSAKNRLAKKMEKQVIF